MVFKCKSCGKSMYWKGKSLVCECGSTEYSIEDNMSNSTCDICGHVIDSRMIAQTCSNCGAFVINKNVAQSIDGIVLPHIDADKAVEFTGAYIKSGEFPIKINKYTVSLMYLAYYLVDGTSYISTIDSNKYTAEHHNFPVFSGNRKYMHIVNQMTFDTSGDDIRKMKCEAVSGAHVHSLEDREAVTTTNILETIRDADLDAVKAQLKQDKADIGFEPTGKMSVLLPVYEVLINNKYKYYVNGQDGTVIGKLYTNKNRLVSSSLIEALGFAAAIAMILVVTGGLVQ